MLVVSIILGVLISIGLIYKKIYEPMLDTCYDVNGNEILILWYNNLLDDECPKRLYKSWIIKRYDKRRN